MIEQVRTQIQVLRVKLDSDLFFLYERNNLISESDHMLSLSSKMYALTDEAKLEITNNNGNYEITKKSSILLAKKFMNQDFKNNLDNIIERGLFSTFLWLALTEFFIEKNNNEQILSCLCVANRIYGSTLVTKNEYYSTEIGKVLILEKSAEGGNAKSKTYKQDRETVMNEWMSGKYHTYTECADALIKSGQVKVAHRTIGVWIGKTQRQIRDNKKPN